MKPAVRIVIFLLLIGPLWVVQGQAAVDVHHDLSIELFPENSALEGWDRIRIDRLQDHTADLYLSPSAQIDSLQLAGENHPYAMDGGRLTILTDASHDTTGITLSIRYRCRFDDPAPVRPLNTDNPGFGVSGTISPVGTFILAGAGWYPRVANARETFDLRVAGPANTVAVTAGRPVGVTRDANRTVSTWSIVRPLEGLSLSAGPYVIERRIRSAFTAVTYLFPGNRGLASRYLEKSLTYIEQYSRLFGDYAYDSFAVVENFFPTGYGFPGYTLMGGRVLNLPFIPETSLPHEIVHSWWGNGVRIDAASGNWCEGLATYTADYLNRENRSVEAARDYRRQALRNYATLVSEATDFPLDRFQQRIDPVTKAVGYDKAAMVFHMLRREMGDDAFWSALRDLYRAFLFRQASWEDLQSAFETRAGRSLDRFFSQWVERPGAPRLHFENVRRIKAQGGGYATTGRLVQKKPYYDLSLKLVLDSGKEQVSQPLRLTGRQTAFELHSRHRPRVLRADPEFDLFRKLAPEEIPPTVNSLKTAASTVVIISGRLGETGKTIARRFTRAMGITAHSVRRDAELQSIDTTTADLLFVGLPESGMAQHLLPKDLAVGGRHFQVAGQRFDQPADLLFAVARRPDDPNRLVALLYPLSAAAADAGLVKIPHYGRYSYLVFRGGRNQIKGTWESDTSPMIVHWATLPSDEKGNR